MSWHDCAACVGKPREMFFPGPGKTHPSNDYRPICKGCPVRVECLAEAMIMEEGMHYTTRQGVFGGKTPKERWELAQEATR